MSNGIIITPGLADGALRRPERSADVLQQAQAFQAERRAARVRSLVAVAVMGLAFMTIAGQLVRLAMQGQTEQRISISAPLATAFARPDIIDRQGRLLASDIVMHSLVADPHVVLDQQEIADKLATVLPDLNKTSVLNAIADKTKRFAWIRRRLSDAEAQRVHDLGLPGLDFRPELRRSYPLGRSAGHILGSVNIDNKGLQGIERYLDERQSVEPVHGPSLSARPPLRLSLDVAVQFAVEEELAEAMRRYSAAAAVGLIMDVNNGEIIAAASLPGLDPIKTDEHFDKSRIDRLAGGTYELGSVFKTLTAALAFEGGINPATTLNTHHPLEVESYPIRDSHPADRPLTVKEIFVKSSNVGAAMLALQDGQQRQQAFLEKLGLTTPLATEAGTVAPAILPQSWGDIETVTISYGHGLAVAPLQFASASAALINGGYRVKPTFLRKTGRTGQQTKRVISPETSYFIRQLMRENVANKSGTGKRADVAGLKVGGKTGTAEIAGIGGYKAKSVIASFLGAFPMDKPRYLTLVCLFEPKGTKETDNKITADTNAAPTTGRIISRVSPLLGFLPD
jgi:cell division protein FtsI (penicillin-binding protein 3)